MTAGLLGGRLFTGVARNTYYDEGRQPRAIWLVRDIRQELQIVQLPAVITSFVATVLPLVLIHEPLRKRQLTMRVERLCTPPLRGRPCAARCAPTSFRFLSVCSKPGIEPVGPSAQAQRRRFETSEGSKSPTTAPGSLAFDERSIPPKTRERKY